MALNSTNLVQDYATTEALDDRMRWYLGYKIRTARLKEAGLSVEAADKGDCIREDNSLRCLGCARPIFKVKKERKIQMLESKWKYIMTHINM